MGEDFITLAPSALAVLVLWRLAHIEKQQDRAAKRIHVLESLVTALCIHAGMDVKPFTGGR
jgi:hypothetical protein